MRGKERLHPVSWLVILSLAVGLLGCTPYERSTSQVRATSDIQSPQIREIIAAINSQAQVRSARIDVEDTGGTLGHLCSGTIWDNQDGLEVVTAYHCIPNPMNRVIISQPHLDGGCSYVFPAASIIYSNIDQEADITKWTVTDPQTDGNNCASLTSPEIFPQDEIMTISSQVQSLTFPTASVAPSDALVNSVQPQNWTRETDTRYCSSSLIHSPGSSGGGVWVVDGNNVGQFVGVVDEVGTFAGSCFTPAAFLADNQ